jgi:hypothetical protein
MRTPFFLVGIRTESHTDREEAAARARQQRQPLAHTSQPTPCSRLLWLASSSLSTPPHRVSDAPALSMALYGGNLSWGGGQSSKNGTIHFLLLPEQRQHASKENVIILVLLLQTLNQISPSVHEFYMRRRRRIPLLCVERSDGPMERRDGPMERSDGPIVRWRWAG